MKTRYPKALVPGDKIAITAPSSGIPNELNARFKLACDHLKARGFHLVFGACLFGNKGYVSAPAAARADELMRFLNAPDIAAIIPPYGGELASELLPLLDFSQLREATPKWLIGYSDISTIACALYSQTSWATVHSSCLMEWVPKQTDPLTTQVFSHLNTAEGGEFVQHSSKFVQSSFPDWKQLPDAEFILDKPSKWQSLNGKTSMSGRLFGGCLDILMLFVDCPYIDIAQIKANHGKEGTVLYLENAELSPQALKRALLSMQFRGVFEHISGLVFGRHAPDIEKDAELSFEHVLHECFDNSAFPVFYDVDIGHIAPNLTLVNGAMVDISLNEDSGLITHHLI